MKRMNFNIKDRKFLITTLSLVIVCVFTLSIAYAALNTILTIQGNAEVVASSWNIYLDNPRVTAGSATTNVPEIKTSSTLEFSTTLNMPGDYYEFTVDVVNDGSIDAMIANVVKTPELTVEQSKYLKYEISYQNGEGISTKQLLAKDSIVPIKVRIEYRKDLGNNDLPIGQVVLDLSLTLEYVQSDGTGSNVTNNGMIRPVANGSIEDVGTIVTIGTEQFYTIGIEDNNVKLLSMYNLYVGGEYNYNTNTWTAYGSEATGMQSQNMLGSYHDRKEGIISGTTAFSDSDTGYNGSLVEKYAINYKNKLEEQYKLEIIESRIMSKSETSKLGCGEYSHYCGMSEYSWIFSTGYWTSDLWTVSRSGGYGPTYYTFNEGVGVRPVIIISKDYFN